MNSQVIYVQILNKKTDKTIMKFKTKSQNLNNLKIRCGSIPKIYFFKVSDYLKNKDFYLKNSK